MAKGIKVKLDKKRHLLVTTEALAAYERVTGKQLMAQSTIANLTLRDMIIMAWAFLLHEDPGLTIDQAQDMILSMRNTTELFNRVQQAVGDFDRGLDQ